MNGFVLNLLKTSAEVFKGATPSEKVTPLGWLEYLLNNTSPNVISQTIAPGDTGFIRDVKIKFRTRNPGGKSTTVDDCSIQAVPAYQEAVIPALLFRQNGIIITYEEMAKYEEEAANPVAISPLVPGGIMLEFYNRLVWAASGLLIDINNDLITMQAASFGKNVTTGLTTAKDVNFPLNTTMNPVSQGMTMLIADYIRNEIKPQNVAIVGDGLMLNVSLQQQFGSQNTTQQNYPAFMPKFYHDVKATDAWGLDNFGVFEKDAVQLINISRFVGFVAGNKLDSIMFSINIPVVTSNGASFKAFRFDAQLEHIKCPTDIEIDGVLTRVDRGWVIRLMANYNQFGVPAGSYEATDRLAGNNGTLRYHATNNAA